jgi:hypothetical protein
MCLQAYLSPSDHRLPEGWPNPRAFMADPAAVAARMDEDGRRIAAEKGDCTEGDLTRLGWRLEQVKAHQLRTLVAWDRLDAEVGALLQQLAEIREDHAPVEASDIDLVDCAPACLAPDVREPDLTDMDIAFGVERAA